MMNRTISQEMKMIPDTLDLAERGRLAINGMLGSLDPDCDFEPYFLTYFDVHPAFMIHWSSMPSGVLPKYVEAMPLLRLMSGSNQDRDIEEGMLGSIVTNISDDGLIYDRATPKRPWNVGFGYGPKGWNEDYANMAGNGRLLTGLLYYYQATGDEVWRERAQCTAERMLELAVVKGEYAYYPDVKCGNDYSYPRKSGWVHTDEPQEPREGQEGAMLFYLLQPVRGFARWYELSGDERFLDLSRRFVNFGLQRKFWGGRVLNEVKDLEPLAGAERGHFWGHYHGTAAALRGLLDYAIIANDFRIKEFVRDSYEWARHHGIHRLGVFAGSGGGTEGCTVADMVGLAVKLTDAGIGEYWEDVEQYARNGLLEVQATNKTEMERVSQMGQERLPNSGFENYGGVLPGQETNEKVIERSIGAFGHLQGARYLVPRLMHCCTGNGCQGLYYAWESIVRQEGDTVQVNLWLNRRSPWVDVWSFMPHEGKLIVRNKGMQRIAVRMPGWVSQGALRCSLNGKDVQPVWIGNRMLFNGLKGIEELSFETPVTLEKTRYTMANLNDRAPQPDEYDCEFWGNTVISVGGYEPPGERYRIFQREHLKAKKAPLKEISPYVHPAKIIRW